MDFIQKNLMPILSKVAQNKVLSAIKDGLSLTIPFTIIGSLFLIIGNFPVEAWMSFVEPYGAYLNVMVSVTFGILGLIATIGVSYFLAKAYDVEPISNVLITIVAFLLATLNPDLTIDLELFGAAGMFTGLIVAVMTVFIYKFFVDKKITISMPEGVPPSVANSFTSLIPGAFILILVWFARSILGIEINSIIQSIFSPLVFGLGTLPGLIVYTLLVCLLWSAGIHGSNLLSGIATPIFLNSLAVNLQAFQSGTLPPNIIVEGYWILFMSIGGTGATLGLVLAMLQSKTKMYKSLGKLSLPSAIFCINEPVIFGFPIVMNPMMMIPFILTPIVLASSTYFLMYFNVIGRIVFVVPWTIPPIIGPYLATNGNIPAAIWSFATIIISYLMYLPFFKHAEKLQLALESNEEVVEIKQEQKPLFN